MTTLRRCSRPHCGGTLLLDDDPDTRDRPRLRCLACGRPAPLEDPTMALPSPRPFPERAPSSANGHCETHVPVDALDAGATIARLRAELTAALDQATKVETALLAQAAAATATRAQLRRALTALNITLDPPLAQTDHRQRRHSHDAERDQAYAICLSNLATDAGGERFSTQTIARALVAAGLSVDERAASSLVGVLSRRHPPLLTRVGMGWYRLAEAREAPALPS